MTNAFAEVYRVVRRIPRGRVMSYGQIADVLSRPLSARAVGWAMNQCPEDVPWQRVVNAQGGISTEHLHEPPDLQRRLLEAEGVRFGQNGALSMKRYRWTPLSAVGPHPHGFSLRDSPAARAALGLKAPPRKRRRSKKK